jgi:hypothetical protein
MKGRFIITVLMEAGLVMGGPLESGTHAGQKPERQNTRHNIWKGKDNVKRTGKRDMNIRVRQESEPGIEVVMGSIDLVRGNHIVMDGEKFSLSRAEIVDEHLGTVGKHELYPALKAHVVLEYGKVKKVIVYGFQRPLQIEGREKLEKQREKMLRRAGN